MRRRGGTAQTVCDHGFVLGGRSIQLARVFGIRIGASPSWFAVLFVIIFLLSNSFKDQFPGQDGKAFALATASALLFFLSILLHELGHAVVAIRNGIGISGIDLWLFGGVAHLKTDVDTPGKEFRIAAAGPLVTLVIAALCLGSVRLLANQPLNDALEFSAGPNASAATAVLGYLGSINALLLLFNLVPAFPLDGGRIARAAIWWRVGDRLRATHLSVKLSRGIAYAIGGLGLFFAIGGHLGGFHLDRFNAIWLVLVAFMLDQFARGAEAQSQVAAQLEGMRVADVMDQEPVTLPGEVKLDRALDEFFIRYGWDWFPVTDVSGRFLGLITRDAVEHVPEALRQGTSTAQAMVADTASTFRIGTDEPLENLLGSEGLRRLGALMAVDRDGVLRGVVTVDQVRRALQPATVA
jgi:Zn-dependent protease